jgi:competence protein ComEA
VVNPGIYILADGSLVNTAINAAGGFTRNAQNDSIDQAALLEDGQQINVLWVNSTNNINITRVNINTVSISELDGLPGIGPTTAQAIIDFRLKSGPFQFIQDIQNVPGIGFTSFNGIKDYITIGP